MNILRSSQYKYINIYGYCQGENLVSEREEKHSYDDCEVAWARLQIMKLFRVFVRVPMETLTGARKLYTQSGYT